MQDMSLMPVNQRQTFQTCSRRNNQTKPNS